MCNSINQNKRCSEAEVNVPTSKAWALFGTLEIAKLLDGTIFEAVDVVEGDGGPSTILKLTFKPGLGFSYCKKKYTKVDHANMVKESQIVEGGILDIGLNLYCLRVEIKENPKDWSGTTRVLKLTIEYDIKEEFATNASLVTAEPLLAIISVANEHF